MVFGELDKGDAGQGTSHVPVRPTFIVRKSVRDDAYRDFQRFFLNGVSSCAQESIRHYFRELLL